MFMKTNRSERDNSRQSHGSHYVMGILIEASGVLILMAFAYAICALGCRL
jgi:hypothetical protein